MADASVETLPDNVDQAVARDDVELDVRIAVGEQWHYRREQEYGSVADDVQPDAAGRRVAKAVQGLPGLVQGLKGRRDRAQNLVPRRSQRHASTGPVEQPDPQPILKALKRVAERGRADAEFV